MRYYEIVQLLDPSSALPSIRTHAPFCRLEQLLRPETGKKWDLLVISDSCYSLLGLNQLYLFVHHRQIGARQFVTQIACLHGILKGFAHVFVNCLVLASQIHSTDVVATFRVIHGATSVKEGECSLRILWNLQQDTSEQQIKLRASDTKLEWEWLRPSTYF